MYIQTSYNVILRKCTILNNEWEGVRVQATYKFRCNDSQIYSNSDSNLLFLNSADFDIVDSAIYESPVGICILNSGCFALRHNAIFGCDMGISVNSARFAVITKCHFERNSDYHIYLNNAYFNKIEYNFMGEIILDEFNFKGFKVSAYDNDITEGSGTANSVDTYEAFTEQTVNPYPSFTFTKDSERLWKAAQICGYPSWKEAAVELGVRDWYDDNGNWIVGRTHKNGLIGKTLPPYKGKEEKKLVKDVVIANTGNGKNEYAYNNYIDYTFTSETNGLTIATEVTFKNGKSTGKKPIYALCGYNTWQEAAKALGTDVNDYDNGIPQIFSLVGITLHKNTKKTQSSESGGNSNNNSNITRYGIYLIRSSCNNIVGNEMFRVKFGIYLDIDENYDVNCNDRQISMFDTSSLCFLLGQDLSEDTSGEVIATKFVGTKVYDLISISKVSGDVVAKVTYDKKEDSEAAAAKGDSTGGSKRIVKEREVNKKAVKVKEYLNIPTKANRIYDNNINNIPTVINQSFFNIISSEQESFLREIYSQKKSGSAYYYIDDQYNYSKKNYTDLINLVSSAITNTANTQISNIVNTIVDAGTSGNPNRIYPVFVDITKMGVDYMYAMEIQEHLYATFLNSGRFDCKEWDIYADKLSDDNEIINNQARCTYAINKLPLLMQMTLPPQQFEENYDKLVEMMSFSECKLDKQAIANHDPEQQEIKEAVEAVLKEESREKEEKEFDFEEPELGFGVPIICVPEQKGGKTLLRLIEIKCDDTIHSLPDGDVNKFKNMLGLNSGMDLDLGEDWTQFKDFMSGSFKNIGDSFKNAGKETLNALKAKFLELKEKFIGIGMQAKQTVLELKKLKASIPKMTKYEPVSPKVKLKSFKELTEMAKNFMSNSKVLKCMRGNGVIGEKKLWMPDDLWRLMMTGINIYYGPIHGPDFTNGILGKFEDLIDIPGFDLDEGIDPVQLADSVVKICTDYQNVADESGDKSISNNVKKVLEKNKDNGVVQTDEFNLVEEVPSLSTVDYLS